MVAALVALVFAGVLLGLVVFVVGIGSLAYLISRQRVSPADFAKVGLAFGVAAGGYVAAVVLIRHFLSP